MHAVADARPIHRVYVDGFWMDKTDVTNEEFATLRQGNRVRDHSGAQTARERFSRCFPRKIWSLVPSFFRRPDHPVPLNDHYQWWSYVKGANWRHPEGPNSSIKDARNIP